MSLSRKLRTAQYLAKERGWSGLARTAWWRQRRTIRVEGCRFSLNGVQDDMRAALFSGIYERDERLAIASHLPSDLPVIELGGCIGVVACLTNKLLSCPAQHVVVEANPLMIPTLNKNRDRNGCSFTILNSAIAYGVQSVTFEPASEAWASRIEDAPLTPRSVTVAATTLAEIVSDFDFGPFCLVCDIEGSEYDLVRHEAGTLSKARTLIIETHSRFIGEAKNQEMLDILRSIGFVTLGVFGNVLVVKNDAA